jgi:hypothetical protein
VRVAKRTLAADKEPRRAKASTLVHLG